MRRPQAMRLYAGATTRQWSWMIALAIAFGVLLSLSPGQEDVIDPTPAEELAPTPTLGTIATMHLDAVDRIEAAVNESTAQ